jgi:arylsulfatase I/J
VDDWGWANLHAHNPTNDEVVTPNLDALMQGGIALDQHYAFQYCSPSRCALQSGRNPIHVNVLNDDIRNHNEAEDPVGGFQGIPVNMTTIAGKLSQAGYQCHAAGKWNAGMATKHHTPAGRGYKTALTYFDMDTDYWSEAKPGCPGPTKGEKLLTVDMWDTNGPGLGLNGSRACSQASQAGCTYQDDVFKARMLGIINNHTAADPPLFLFWASHVPHDPYQAPQSYLDKFASITQPERQFYSAMVNVLDDMVGEVVAALKAKGIWDNLILVAASDNGGPVGSGYGANNWPLRGGKSSNWQGGVRVNAFVTGGFVPPARRGTTEAGLIELSDWYTTFCALAGVDAADPVAEAAGLFPPDGLNMWPLLSGANATPPREFVFLGGSDTNPQSGNTIVQGVIRSDGYKLLLGKVHNNWWQGPVYPNSTT